MVLPPFLPLIVTLPKDHTYQLLPYISTLVQRVHLSACTNVETCGSMVSLWAIRAKKYVGEGGGRVEWRRAQAQGAACTALGHDPWLGPLMFCRGRARRGVKAPPDAALPVCAGQCRGL